MSEEREHPRSSVARLRTQDSNNAGDLETGSLTPRFTFLITTLMCFSTIGIEKDICKVLLQ